MIVRADPVNSRKKIITSRHLITILIVVKQIGLLFSRIINGLSVVAQESLIKSTRPIILIY